MNLTVSSITVMFEDPFWIGLYEREWNGRYEVCKITFGAEPKDCQDMNWARFITILPSTIRPITQALGMYSHKPLI